MKGTKTQKGITLVALIITIVVLLILAVVAVNSIGDTGIIGQAENAAKTYNNSVRNEAGILGGYEDFFEEETRCIYGNHDWGEDLTIIEMTCKDGGIDGEKERTCAKCGITERKPVPWTHSYDNDNWNANCTVCGFECQHNDGTTSINDGYYKQDGYHSHSFFEECNICGYYVSAMGPDPSCYYMTADGKCSICGGTNSHDWWEGQCNYCWTTCGHNEGYTNGNCNICGEDCIHEGAQPTSYEGKSTNNLLNYGDHAVLGNCTKCGLNNIFIEAEKCTYENGKCTKCEDSCTHPYGFNGGSCEFCGAECQHTNLGEDAGYAYYDENNHYTNEICYDCWWYSGNTYEYPHYFYDGYCQCGYQCEHDMNNGTCSKCGYECSHDWSNYDGVCKKCGIECNHEFSYGSCATCGAACPHTSTTWGDPYSMGDSMHESVEICNVCNSTINGVGYEHDYTNSYCSTCGHTCEHGGGYAFSEGQGKCTYCGSECEHPSYSEGVCTVCGKAQ